MNSKDKPYDLKERTRQFALRIIRLYAAMPKNATAQVIGKQMLRSGTSVGAQYREGLRSRSKAEFVSKIEASIQELEETIYWMELIPEAKIFPEKRTIDLRQEANELTAILISCVKKVKEKSKKKS